jgi:hypothetical protein
MVSNAIQWIKCLFGFHVHKIVTINRGPYNDATGITAGNSNDMEFQQGDWECAYCHKKDQYFFIYDKEGKIVSATYSCY